MTGVQIVNGASPNLFFLLTNDNPKVSKITSNPQFQQAVRYGINYASLVQLAGKGAVQAAGIIPTMFLGSLPAGSGATYNLAKAKAALAASGVGHPTLNMVYPSDIPGERDQLRRPGRSGAAGPAAGRDQRAAAGPVDPGGA